MREKSDFLIETDLIIEHLTFDKTVLKSSLEIAMEKGFCFTTVINSSELLFAAKSDIEKKYIHQLLSALKVLGLNSRYSFTVNEYKGKVLNVRDAIICAVAKINKLQILTNNPDKFNLTGLEILHPNDLRG